MSQRISILTLMTPDHQSWEKAWDGWGMLQSLASISSRLLQAALSHGALSNQPECSRDFRLRLEEEGSFHLLSLVQDKPRGQGCLPDAEAVGHNGKGNQCGAEANYPVFTHENLGEHNWGGTAVIHWPLPAHGPAAATPFAVLLVEKLNDLFNCVSRQFMSGEDHDWIDVGILGISPQNSIQSDKEDAVWHGLSNMWMMVLVLATPVPSSFT